VRRLSRFLVLPILCGLLLGGASSVLAQSRVVDARVHELRISWKGSCDWKCVDDGAVLYGNLICCSLPPDVVAKAAEGCDVSKEAVTAGDMCREPDALIGVKVVADPDPIKPVVADPDPIKPVPFLLGLLVGILVGAGAGVLLERRRSKD